ncbi:Os10g0511900 [Oryza sativa Japonica Group]|jgi:hypothetical protein|uniref:Os10g0511900 protein n=1 Tax=Oryza sativa subsp. japonica TaxID=39947 RepID=Q0IWF9_ORYSJ|nr:Os10g0511900 [Oryza sativa Japonica Group]|eukprot:NP_001065042.1 Os10g0511900 [Oryza sativa Japonica Group]
MWAEKLQHGNHQVLRLLQGAQKHQVGSHHLARARNLSLIPHGVPAKAATRLRTNQQHQQLNTHQKPQGDKETTTQILLAGETLSETRAGIHPQAMRAAEAAILATTMTGTIRAANHGVVAQIIPGDQIIVKNMATVARRDHRRRGGNLKGGSVDTTRMATAGRALPASSSTVENALTFLYSPK